MYINWRDESVSAFFGGAVVLHAADKLGLPRIVSIQNPYSLLNRNFETGLSEFTHRDGIGLLAHSPMAFGWLSGKYENGALLPVTACRRHNSPPPSSTLKLS